MTTRKDDERRTGDTDALAGRAAEGMLGPNPFIGLRPEDLAETVRLIGAQAVKQPALVLEQQAAFARDLIAALSGNAELAPEKGDRRFADSAWKENPFYRMYLQGYLAWSNALGGFVDQAAVDDRTRERIRYVVSLATEALAPTNTLVGNPAALKKMIDSGGAKRPRRAEADARRTWLPTRACRRRSTSRRSASARTSQNRRARWCTRTRCSS